MAFLHLQPSFLMVSIMYAIAGKRLLLSCADVPQCECSGLEPDALPYIHPRVDLTSMESLSNEVATQIKSVSYYTTSSGEWSHTELNCNLWDFTPALYHLSYMTKFGCWLTLYRCLTNQLPNMLLMDEQ